ncbi:hypothetical protein BB558_002307 [Smittium angustum]|uniref:SWIM-type domain-containing protein n=1 Tax=Smittium angustum TaxID=133377 RepID=A0A2U1J914_SMIAN|nr:hypothetical protein BB558_002307 [Smittium angustum]
MSVKDVSVRSPTLLSPEKTETTGNGFLEHIKKIDQLNRIGIIISDSNKGLLSSIYQVFGYNVLVSSCIRHMKVDFSKKFDWISKTNPKLWTRFCIPKSRFGAIASNAIEVVFSAFKEIRFFPSLDILINLENYILEKRCNRLAFGLEIKAGNGLLPFVKKKPEKNYSDSKSYLIRNKTSENVVIVRLSSSNDWFVANLNEYNCFCGEFQEFGIPCSHAISASDFLKIDITSLLSNI